MRCAFESQNAQLASQCRAWQDAHSPALRVCGACINHSAHSFAVPEPGVLIETQSVVNDDIGRARDAVEAKGRFARFGALSVRRV